MVQFEILSNHVMMMLEIDGRFDGWKYLSDTENMENTENTGMIRLTGRMTWQIAMAGRMGSENGDIG
jgi:hypothetical protein